MKQPTLVLICWLVWCAGGCTSEHRATPSPRVVNYTTPGNLAPSDITATAVSKTTNPVDIANLASTAFSNNPRESLRLFYIASLYAMFDMRRVSDRSAHQAWLAVKADLGLEKIRLWGLRHPVEFHQVLEENLDWARKNGFPIYEPTWMSQHGLGAVTGRDHPLQPGFNPQLAWNEAQKELLDFLDKKEFWATLNTQVSPENAKATLQDAMNAVVESYAKFDMAQSKLDRIKGKLAAIVDKYDDMPGSPGDRVYTLESEMDGYLQSELLLEQ